MTSEKSKVIMRRFLKAFLAGFASGLVLVSTSDVKTWADLNGALNAIAFAGVLGGLNGIILAAQKAFAWKK